MPELPEVTTISNQLKKELAGKSIQTVFIHKDYKTLPTNEIFIETVTEARILDVFRIAKVIVISLEKERKTFHLTIHLAMTGNIKFYEKDAMYASNKNYLVKINFNDSGSVSFSDTRRFGYVKLLDEGGLSELKKKYGPDPLEITEEEFSSRLRSKNTNIKNALLDQSLIAGVGNIYANDALFLAGIHPQTKTNNLPAQAGIAIQQYGNLLISLKTILLEGIDHRGSTLADEAYTDIYGKGGTHQNYFRIYGKAGQNCDKCGSKISFIVLNGRGTYFCPSCQKL